MTHISSIGAGMFSDMSVAVPLVDMTPAQIAAVQTEATYAAAFAAEVNAVTGVKAAGTFLRLPNVREFPSMGTAPNLTNVPRYGFKTSAQVQGQSDSASMEVTINYVPAEWAKDTTLGDIVGDGQARMFRFALLNARPTGFVHTAAGLGTVENSNFFFIGKLEALQFSPQLTDANQATLTISMLSELEGAFTV